MVKNTNITLDFNNQDFMNAWNLVTNTHRSIFLTGKAGTGKSTFLRYICETTKKKYVVLAPTGIAAVAHPPHRTPSRRPYAPPTPSYRWASSVSGDD